MCRVTDGATSTATFFMRNSTGVGPAMWAPNDSQSRKCISGNISLKLIVGDTVTIFAQTDNGSAPNIAGLDFCGNRLT